MEKHDIVKSSLFVGEKCLWISWVTLIQELASQQMFNKVIKCSVLYCNQPVNMTLSSHEPATFWQSTNIGLHEEWFHSSTHGQIRLYMIYGNGRGVWLSMIYGNGRGVWLSMTASRYSLAPGHQHIGEGVMTLTAHRVKRSTTVDQKSGYQCWFLQDSFNSIAVRTRIHRPQSSTLTEQYKNHAGHSI